MISITNIAPILWNFHAKLKIKNIGTKKLMSVGISKQFLKI